MVHSTSNSSSYNYSNHYSADQNQNNQRPDVPMTEDRNSLVGLSPRITPPSVSPNSSLMENLACLQFNPDNSLPKQVGGGGNSPFPKLSTLRLLKSSQDVIKVSKKINEDIDKEYFYIKLIEGQCKNNEKIKNFLLIILKKLINNQEDHEKVHELMVECFAYYLSNYHCKSVSTNDAASSNDNLIDNTPNHQKENDRGISTHELNKNISHEEEMDDFEDWVDEKIEDISKEQGFSLNATCESLSLTLSKSPSYRDIFCSQPNINTPSSGFYSDSISGTLLDNTDTEQSRASCLPSVSSIVKPSRKSFDQFINEQTEILSCLNSHSEIKRVTIDPIRLKEATKKIVSIVEKATLAARLNQLINKINERKISQNQESICFEDKEIELTLSDSNILLSCAWNDEGKVDKLVLGKQFNINLIKGPLSFTWFITHSTEVLSCLNSHSEIKRVTIDPIRLKEATQKIVSIVEKATLAARLNQLINKINERQISQNQESICFEDKEIELALPDSNILLSCAWDDEGKVDKLVLGEQFNLCLNNKNNMTNDPVPTTLNEIDLPEGESMLELGAQGEKRALTPGLFGSENGMAPKRIRNESTDSILFDFAELVLNTGAPMPISPDMPDVHGDSQWQKVSDLDEVAYEDVEMEDLTTSNLHLDGHEASIEDSSQFSMTAQLERRFLRSRNGKDEDIKKIAQQAGYGEQSLLSFVQQVLAQTTHETLRTANQSQLLRYTANFFNNDGRQIQVALLVKIKDEKIIDIQADTTSNPKLMKVAPRSAQSNSNTIDVHDSFQLQEVSEYEDSDFELDLPTKLKRGASRPLAFQEHIKLMKDLPKKTNNYYRSSIRSLLLYLEKQNRLWSELVLLTESGKLDDQHRIELEQVINDGGNVHAFKASEIRLALNHVFKFDIPTNPVGGRARALAHQEHTDLMNNLPREKMHPDHLVDIRSFLLYLEKQNRLWSELVPPTENGKLGDQYHAALEQVVNDGIDAGLRGRTRAAFNKTFGFSLNPKPENMPVPICQGEHIKLMEDLPKGLHHNYRLPIRRFLHYLEEQGRSWSELVPLTESGTLNGRHRAALEQAVNDGIDTNDLHSDTRAALNKAFGFDLKSRLKNMLTSICQEEHTELIRNLSKELIARYRSSIKSFLLYLENQGRLWSELVPLTESGTLDERHRAALEQAVNDSIDAGFDPGIRAALNKAFGFGLKPKPKNSSFQFIPS